MLTGRESLRRVIGKRRRRILNLPRIFSSCSSPNAVEIRNEALIDDNTAKKAKLIDGKFSPVNDITDEFGTCPVCSSKICGDNRTINSHIDLCLVRGTGTKRKLSQRTLLQFSFSSNSQSKVCVADRVPVGAAKFQMAIASEPAESSLSKPEYVGNSEVTCVRSQHEMASSHLSTKSSSCLESTTAHKVEASLEKDFIDSNTNGMVDNHKLSPKLLESSFDVAGFISTLCGMGLETYIVGRKFGDGLEVTSGERFSLLREHDNIKDPNAIKVVSPDPDGQRILGYLPWDLAQYLSPLIDKYQLTFEGVITSVPKSPAEVVPIEIMCLPTPPFNEVENYDLATLKSLCEKIFNSIKLGKMRPPNTTKYQQNFHFMVEEVLRSDVHLFTADEKIFLESFSSMSDDGQRLFVRIYTRKGPWFRISNISYPEILDYEVAVHELSEASYIHSFGYNTEINDVVLLEILDILNVGELCEIMRIFKGLQDSKVGTRKKNLIAALYSAYKDGLWYDEYLTREPVI